ncbi:MAG: hypothetical protein AAGJ31_10995, partial [Verrucomicrobiota bacterium]
AAEATELGKYKNLVNRAIEKRWHFLRVQHEAFVTYGSLKIRFEVRKDGRVSGLRVIHDDANSIMTSFSLDAVASARIPVMPESVSSQLGGAPLEVTYDILIY